MIAPARPPSRCSDAASAASSPGSRALRRSGRLKVSVRMSSTPQSLRSVSANFGQEQIDQAGELAGLLDRDRVARAFDHLEPAAVDSRGDDLRRLRRAVLIAA